MARLALVPRKEHLLSDAFQDFLLSRQASRCTSATLAYYADTAGGFVRWAIAQGVEDPAAIMGQHVRAYIAEVAGRDVSDGTLHCHARATKTFLRFLVAEGYRTDAIPVTLPRVAQKRLPVLNAGELRRLIDAAETVRDTALVLVLADTGVRRAEALALNWGDVDLATTGLVRVRRGKGGKARTVVIGIRTRRALLKLRRSVSHADNDPLFQTGRGRLKASGLRMVLKRTGARAGVTVTAHAMRRTFAVLSLRGGMSAIHLRDLLGHSDFEMVARYARLLEDDLQAAHEAAGPVDRLMG